MKNYLKIGLLALLAMVATALPVCSQTNISLAGTGAYYNISNSVVLNSGALLLGDKLVGGTTFDYTQGTNQAGGALLPAGVNRSRYVAFSLTSYTTNSSAHVETAIIQGSTGQGDWQSLVPSLVVTPTATATTNTWATNTTYDTGGLVMFRVKSVQSTEAGTTNSIITVGMSSKAGI